MNPNRQKTNIERQLADILKETADLSAEELTYVELSAEWRDELLDPEGWSTVLETFARTTKLAVALAGPDGHLLGGCHNPQQVWLVMAGAQPSAVFDCPFCLVSPEPCNAAAEALKTGEVTLVENWAGLSHVAVPISLGGQPLGALFAGQVFTGYPQQLPLQRVARNLGISSQELWHLAVQQVPVPSARLRLFGELLMSLGQSFLGQRYAAILQRKLTQTSHRYRLFFEGVKDYALLTVNPSGMTTSWNSGAERLFGYREGEILGEPASRLAVPDDVQGTKLQRPMAEADRSGWVEWEGWQVRNDGTRFLGAIVLASLGKGQDHEFGMMIRDVTERRRSEKELQQAQKMEGIGVLAGGIAHDFNNLLTGIIVSLSFVKSGMAPDDASYPMIEIAEQSSARAAELVAQLLAYAGRGQFVTTRFGLSTLISELLPLIAASIPKKAKLELALIPGLPWIEADASQIRQLVMNLVINGAEAIDTRGGTVEVSTGLSPSGTDVWMVVKDSGSGMSETTKAKMFEPFFSTKFAGRGLGLAAVSGIVRGHKGKMQVDSTPGEGTTFTVSFPAVPAENRAPAEPSATTIPQGAGGTILVVDDEPSLRQVAQAILESAGYSVLVAKDGREAVDIFEQNASIITAVFMDMTMPVMGGHAAFELIRKIKPSVPIVLSSGYSEDSARSEFRPEDEVRFLQKPYTAANLVNSIQHAL